jgi:hypothetical protein
MKLKIQDHTFADACASLKSSVNTDRKNNSFWNTRNKVVMVAAILIGFAVLYELTGIGSPRCIRECGTLDLYCVSDTPPSGGFHVGLETFLPFCCKKFN